MICLNTLSPAFYNVVIDILLGMGVCHVPLQMSSGQSHLLQWGVQTALPYFQQHNPKLFKYNIIHLPLCALADIKSEMIKSCKKQTHHLVVLYRNSSISPSLLSVFKTFRENTELPRSQIWLPDIVFWWKAGGRDKKSTEKKEKQRLRWGVKKETASLT